MTHAAALAGRNLKVLPSLPESEKLMREGVCTAVPWVGSGKINLLIVDDSELNLKVLEGILSRKHANITKANNGLEALSYLLQFEHGFDAVVMDVKMPFMDGLEAGMNAVLHKPLQPDELMFVLNKLIKPVKV